MRKSVLITGATSGLGRHTATRLAATGRHVILGHRDNIRAEITAAAIRDTVPQASLSTLHLDLADLGSITDAAAQLRTRPPLHTIICNAAIQVITGVSTSTDGYELTFATNHLGHFHLVTSLLDHLTDDGRIIVISSGTHLGPKESLGFPAPQWRDPHQLADPQSADPSPTAGRSRYSTSKLANILFTYQLAERLKPRGITANAYDPGLMPDTRLSRDYPRPVRALYRMAAPVIAATMPVARTATTSARLCAELVTGRQWDGVTGTYIVGDAVRQSSPQSYDHRLAAQLWTTSEELIARARTANSSKP